MQTPLVRHRGRRPLVTLATATTLLFPLSACGSDDPESTADGPELVEVQPQESDSPGTTSPDAAPGELTPQMVTLVNAGRTAEQAVSGSQVVAVELAEGEWEVDVVTQDGTEHEVRVSEDGTTVIGDPRSDDTDADDKQENQESLSRAVLDFEEALNAFATQHNESEVEEISLDLDGNELHWEIDLRNGDGHRVDAATADVVRR